jgi:hypothetical protein
VLVAAHQPAFLPWLGYLDKMARADLFVVVDCVQYEAQNFQNRNRIKRHDGAGWLTVPVHRGQRDRVDDKRICDERNPRHTWRRRVWGALVGHYGRAPWFARYADELHDVIAVRPWQRLIDLDLATLELARRWLGITRPMVRSSTLDLVGGKTDRIIDLCRKVNATTYLSGSGGSAGYLDVAAMRRAGIDVVWQRFAHPVHPQRYPHLGFLPNLAFVDLVLNCGPEARAILGHGAAP